MKKFRHIKFDYSERISNDLIIRDTHFNESWSRSPEDTLALLSSIKTPLKIDDVSFDDEGRAVIRGAFMDHAADSLPPRQSSYVDTIINWYCRGLTIDAGVTTVNDYCGWPIPPSIASWHPGDPT